MWTMVYIQVLDWSVEPVGRTVSKHFKSTNRDARHDQIVGWEHLRSKRGDVVWTVVYVQVLDWSAQTVNTDGQQAFQNYKQRCLPRSGRRLGASVFERRRWCACRGIRTGAGVVSSICSPDCQQVSRKAEQQRETHISEYDGGVYVYLLETLRSTARSRCPTSCSRVLKLVKKLKVDKKLKVAEGRSQNKQHLHENFPPKGAQAPPRLSQ